jgi:hypothetical protein
MRFPFTPTTENLSLFYPQTVDVKMVPVSVGCVTSSNPNSLSSSENGFNHRTSNCKKHLSDRTRCPKAIGGIYLTKN